jgi:hypothetical protein
MATTATTANATNATAAEFRAWAQFVHDVFANGSWVQTADTGQINLTTVGAPGAANTKMGYEVWRMDDSLQSTSPVFLKLAYGSGSVGATAPAIWFTVGSGTDGAGNLVDPNDADRPAYYVDFYSQASAPIRSRAASASSHVCFGSATTERAVFLAFEAKPSYNLNGNGCDVIQNIQNPWDSNGSPALMFSIERSRDVAGDTTGTHLILAWNAPGSNGGLLHQVITLDHSYVANPHSNTTASPKPASPAGAVVNQWYATAAGVPNTGTGAISSSIASGELSVYPIVPYEENSKPMWPGINLILSAWALAGVGAPSGGPPCNGTQVVNYVGGKTAEVAPYGTTRTYRFPAGIMGSVWNGGTNSAVDFVWMLYE